MLDSSRPQSGLLCMVICVYKTLKCNFTSATLICASISCRNMCVCRLSVCLSQVGVLLKWLNVGSRKQRHEIAQGF